MAVMTIENTQFFHSNNVSNVNMDNHGSDAAMMITTDSSSSSSSSLSDLHSCLPAAHHQFLPLQNIVEYENLKCPDAINDNDNDDNDYFDDSYAPPSSSCCRNDRQYQQRWNGSASTTTEKVSAVKKRGGGSWLLGFARIPQVASGTATTTDMEDESTPGLVSLEEESDDTLSTSQHSTASTSSSNSSASSGSSASSSSKRGVSFNTAVAIRPVPHASLYTHLQRKKMYATSHEVRQNKIRNKKEYRYDAYDWRNATEEWEMSVCMVTGELVHPVHTAC
jgi:hypothetical protein